MGNSYSMEIHEACSSTMDLAQNWVSQKRATSFFKPHFIQCYTQDAGRGKGSRVWISEKGNFFGTLIVPFPFEVHKGGEVAFLTAVAVGDALRTIKPALDVKFKWPNDFMILGKKVGGVLLERLEGDNKTEFLSIGVGLNFISHPENIPSTCLKNHMDIPDLDYFRSLFIDKLLYYYDLWVRFGFSEIRNLWLKCAFNINEVIQFVMGKETVVGIFKTINQAGALILIGPDGAERTFYTGEVFGLNREGINRK